MKSIIVKFNRTVMQAALLFVYAAALVGVAMVSLPQTAQAGDVTAPAVPANIAVPAGNIPYLLGHATGTQNYICLPNPQSPTGVAFTLFTPQATLFDEENGQISTHFFSPNPVEGGTVRAAWQDAKDSSSVWGRAFPGHASTDPAFVAPGAIPWLLVTAVGSQMGPHGGDRLVNTTYIHRVNTMGGAAPAAGCTSAAEIGAQAFVPYTTDYVFYRTAPAN